MENITEPIRVLHIVGRMDRGGIETMIDVYKRQISKSQQKLLDK